MRTHGNGDGMKSVEILAELIVSARRIGVLSGAGISTSAGIPDFRGPQGLYAQSDIDAEKLFDINYFMYDPTLFYRALPGFYDTIRQAKPGPAHRFIHELERREKLHLLVTQNIDGLHTKAGNTAVTEIHGGFNYFKCLRCEAVQPVDESIDARIRAAQVPLCAHCGGVLKPDIVFFGEHVIGFDEATVRVQQCDLFMAIGTTLVVNPAALLPQYLGHAASFAIINRGHTPYDRMADLKIEEDIDLTVGSLRRLLGWDQ
jgi:NAD-dependent deacetylase